MSASRDRRRLRRLPLATLVAVAGGILLAGSGPAAGAKTPGPRLFGTQGQIVQIAADGPRVALATTFANGGCNARVAQCCDRVVVWNEQTGAYSRIVTAAACGDSIFRPGLKEIAIAGTRVAWLADDGGAHLERWVGMARLRQTKPTRVAYVENGMGGDGDVTGDWLDSLFGDGAIIGYNRWHVCERGASWNSVVSACSAQTPAGQDDVQQQTLWTLTNGHRARILHGDGARDLGAVDAGRLVVAHDSVVDIYSAKGTLEQTIPDPWVSGASGYMVNNSAGVACCALSGNLLVLGSWNKDGSENPRLDIYDVDTAKSLKRISIPRDAVLRDLQGSLAVLVENGHVYVIDVRTGRRLTITPPGSGDVDAQIEQPGLFYSYGLPHGRGAVAFLPMAQLERQLR